MEKPKPTTPEPQVSRTWEQVEGFVREHVQQFIQALLEEEGTELLGRTRSARREAVDAAPGYRNGYGKPRRLTLTSGAMTVRRPHVRDLNERFVSRVLPLFKRQTKEVGELLPQLYLHGLALGDFELALRGLLGEGAPLSPASLLRLKTQWQVEYEAWKQRRLDDLEVVYIWAEGLYVKAGLEDTKAALLVMIGALSNGQKVVLAVESGQRESKESGGRCYATCASVASSPGGARLPMGIWDYGQRWVNSIPPWRSKDAGTTALPMCLTRCRRNTRRRPVRCCVPCPMRKPKRPAKPSVRSSPLVTIR